MMAEVLLRIDEDKGWIFHDGDPHWRSTPAALARIKGQKMRWLTRPYARVLHLLTGQPIATMRHIPAHKRWIARIEGFSFWGESHILGTSLYKEPMGFERVEQARRFVETVVTQAGATIIVN